MTDHAATALFGVSTLVAGLAGVFVSGMFPRGGRPASMRTAGASALIAAAGLAAIVLTVCALLVATGQLPTPWLIIAGGLGVLFAPVLYQTLPSWLADTRQGAAALSVIAIALTAGWLGLP